jgi:hypothetical protein
VLAHGGDEAGPRAAWGVADQDGATVAPGHHLVAGDALPIILGR